MRAGQLRAPVVLERPTEATAASGQLNKPWAAITTNPNDWADIEMLSGNEFFRAQSAFGAVTARVRLRFRTDLHEKMRARDTVTGHAWEFRSPPMDPDGRRRTVEFVAVRQVP